MLWHNRRVHTLPLEVSVECLFARFAWTIFSPSVFRDFLNAGKPRRILVWDQESRRHEVEEAGPERCRSIYTAARSRSPRKRPRETGGVQQDDDEGLDAHQDQNASSDMDSGYHDDSILLEGEATTPPDEPQRGRTRKRKADKSCDPLLETEKCDNGRAKTDQLQHYTSHRSPRLGSYRPAKKARGRPCKTMEGISIARAGD